MAYKRYSEQTAKPEILRCAIYTRKSTEENLHTDFTSLDAQREYCLSFIKSREPQGWVPHEERYDDAGWSGGNMDRPALKKLLEDAKKRKFQIVVCYKFDRLSRHTRDFLHILDTFEKNGVAFVSVTQPIDTTSSIGRLMRSILMDFAQFEREMISERTRDKFAAMARKGKRLGGVPSLGYDFDTKTKTLVVNPDESKRIEEIFSLYRKLKSLRLTAERLNEMGVRMKSWMKRDGSKSIGGGIFNKTNLFYLLSNPLYTGKIRYKRDLFPGEHQAIISEGLFEEVNELLRTNGDGKHYQPRRSDTGYTYLLQGILRCGTCGYTMTPHYAISKGRRYHYYKCVPVMKMNHAACAVKSVRAAQIDNLVLERLKILAVDTTVMEDIVRRTEQATCHELPEKHKERALATAELGKIESELANVFKLIGIEGPESPRKVAVLEQLDKAAAKKEELKFQLDGLTKEIQRLENQKVDADVVRNNLVQFTGVFGELGPSHQRELMALIIKNVVYDIQGKALKLTLRPLPEMRWELDSSGVVLQPVQESSGTRIRT